MAAGHDHQHAAAGGPDDGAGIDWFKALDVVVWVSVAVITILAAEWIVGYLAREALARGADRYLAGRTTEAKTD